MQGRATTLLDVFNKALGLLGEVPCTTLTPAPDTKAGIKMAVHLYDSIDEAQSCFYWHELITSELIVADATNHFDGRKRYALPDNCLRPLGVRLEGGDGLPESAYTRLVAQESEYDYDVEGNFLLTSAESVSIVYIKRSDDPTEWTPELLRCIVHLAAANSAQAITQDSGIARNLLEKYEALVKPYAKRLQSKYKTNFTPLPVGFGAWRANRG
jgi:hypothetical protein